MKIGLAAVLISLLGASFLLQPLQVRLPGGVPFAGSLMAGYVVLTCLAVAATWVRPSGTRAWWPIPRFSWTLAISIVASAWLALDWVLGDGVANGLAMAVYLLFFGGFCSTAWEKNQLAIMWGSSLTACFLLVGIGLWRFIFGYQGEGTEYEGPVWRYLKEDYFPYFGISYTRSTRNSDFLYLFPPLFFFLCRLVHAPRVKLRTLAAVLLLMVPTALSFCRSGWLAGAMGAGSIFIYQKKIRVLAKLFVAVAVLLIALNFVLSDKLFSNLHERVASMVSLKPGHFPADVAMATMKISSNEERISLLQMGIRQFWARPLGSGATLLSEDRMVKTRPVHFENFYLDLLVVFGVFAIPVILVLFGQPLMQAKHLCKKDPWIFSSMGLAGSIFLPVYCLFNSVMDFAFFWFLAALSSASVQSSTPHGPWSARHDSSSLKPS